MEKQANLQLRIALHFIKIHIKADGSKRSRDLHLAVQRIVTVARNNGLLMDSEPVTQFDERLVMQEKAATRG